MSDLQSFFVDGQIELDGKTYRLRKSEADRLVSRGQYWHGKGDPSSWLCVAAFLRVRSKYKTLPQSGALALVAQSMEISAEKLRAALAWHEQYVRFHDGSPDYYVLEPDPETG